MRAEGAEETDSAWSSILHRFRAGELSPQIAVTQLVLNCGDVDPVARLAAAAAGEPADERLAELARFAGARRSQINRVRALTRGGLDPDCTGGPDQTVARTRELFDRLAREAPVAGVALYSLDDPSLLDAATTELAEVVARWTTLNGRTVLDFGCGIGRVSAALSGRAERVIGVELSSCMLDEARRRCADLPGLEFRLSNGTDLAVVETGSVDVLLAVDSYPYLVRAGGDVLARHLAEAARVLRPGGELIVFNWSYRGDGTADALEAAALGEAAGFELVRAGERPFRIWDGVGFHLRLKPRRAAAPKRDAEVELFRRDPNATPFQSAAWQDAWTATVGSPNAYAARAKDGAGRLIGWLPLFLWNDDGVRRLVPVGAGTSDYSDALIDGEQTEAAVAGLFAAIEAAPIEFDVLTVPDLRPTSALANACPSGWTAEDEAGEVCPVLSLAPGELGEIVPHRQRRKITLNRNRAERLGGVTVALAERDEVLPALDALFALHAARWERAGESGVLADPRIQAFHRAAAPALADAGLLRMVVVRHEGRPVGVFYAATDGRRWHAYISGVDMSVPGQSFGTLAMAFMIEQAVAEGATELHFLRGEEPYKFAWGAEPRRTIRRTWRRV